ncbi:MAG: cobyrinic acid a,c-diamide synthase [Tepidanaerobacteraceae bacterium]|nr:cobyrinic acid a,c-diamide synthase [Tepidanaerobacteraceae bacterium]
MKIPRIILAGTNSGCGKTTLSAGIMAALVKRGIAIQPFKVGPDYIDPMFHTFVAGRYSRNLDSWLLDEATVMHLFQKNAYDCDMAFIEGVMGLYDGLGASSIEGSTAHVSRILKSPVVIVMNAYGMALSAAALLQGYKEFKGGTDIRGVILNRIGSFKLYACLKDIIEKNTGIRVLGYVPHSEEYTLPERHLGLVPGAEVADLRDRLDRLACAVEKTVDLDMLMDIAKEAPELQKSEAGIPVVNPGAKIKIAVAWDKAFNFYYRDNLDLLEMMGAELIYFSPMEDTSLPHGIHGVYFGGGFPEVFARELSLNTSMRNDVRQKLLNGLPAYAECGGLMYLCRTLRDKNGETFDMAGVIPAKSEMTQALQRFGYSAICFCKDNILGNAGTTTRAHEFHYSILKVEAGQEFEYCYEVQKPTGRSGQTPYYDGIKIKNVLAAYQHIHFWSNQKLAANFIENCVKYRDGA